MFKAKDEITEAVKRTLTVLAGLNRGEVAPWDVIEGAAGFPRGHGHWSSFSQRLKRDLRRSRGICLWAVRGVGWKLLTVAEQLQEQAVRRQQRAGRQLHRGLQEVGSLPAEELTLHQQAGKARRLDIMRSSLRQTRYGSRTTIALGKPTSSGVPRPPRKKAG